MAGNILKDNLMNGLYIAPRNSKTRTSQVLAPRPRPPPPPRSSSSSSTMKFEKKKSNTKSKKSKKSQEIQEIENPRNLRKSEKSKKFKKSVRIRTDGRTGTPPPGSPHFWGQRGPPRSPQVPPRCTRGPPEGGGGGGVRLSVRMDPYGSVRTHPSVRTDP